MSRDITDSSAMPTESGLGAQVESFREARRNLEA